MRNICARIVRLCYSWQALSEAADIPSVLYFHSLRSGTLTMRSARSDERRRCCALMKSEPNLETHDHPTILVAVSNIELRSTLVAALRAQDYLVLEAADGVGALHVLQTHSRPIHLMLTNTGMDKRFMKEALKRYRPEMKVLFVGQQPRAGIRGVPSPTTVLARVKAFFE